MCENKRFYENAVSVRMQYVYTASNQVEVHAAYQTIGYLSCLSGFCEAIFYTIYNTLSTESSEEVAEASLVTGELRAFHAVIDDKLR